MENTNSLQVKKEINASLKNVWDALVTPETIKQYLFGTDTITDWKIGGPIIFQGTWEGVAYRDKGTILEFVPQKKLKYDYWSSFSKLEDKPENYQQISFELSEADNKIILVLTQENIPGQAAKEHSEANWEMVLDQIKKIVENN